MPGFEVGAFAQPFIRSCRRRCESGSSRRMREERLDRRGRIVGSEERIAVVLLPQLEDRVGRRVVLAARLPRHLLARLRDTMPFSDRPSGGRASRPAARRRFERHDPRRVLEHAQRYRLVDETDPLGAARVDRFAGQQHVEGRRRADELRQPLHAVHAADRASLQAARSASSDRRAPRVAQRARARRRRPCRSRSHRGGGKGQLGQFLEHVPAQSYERHRLCGDLKRVNSRRRRRR